MPSEETKVELTIEDRRKMCAEELKPILEKYDLALDIAQQIVMVDLEAIRAKQIMQAQPPIGEVIEAEVVKKEDGGEEKEN